MTPIEPQLTDTDWRNFARGVLSVALFWVIQAFVGKWIHSGIADAAVFLLRLILLVALAGGAICFVETRLRGRARWWGRIAELAVASGALLVSIVWELDRPAWVMAGLFWVGLCALMATWMMTRVDIPDA